MEKKIIALDDFKQLFEKSLHEFFDVYISEITIQDEMVLEIIQHLKKFTLSGGKRIRPILLFCSAQCFSGGLLSDVIKVAIACELMQSFLLIHDDIMDESETRRGEPTLHVQFQNKKNQAKTSAKYAEAMAILIGDIAGYLGIKPILDTQVSASIKNDLIQLYYEACVSVGFGQTLDMTPVSLQALTEANIYDLYRYKTSVYTSEFPLLAGVILSEQYTMLAPFRALGKQLGILFQIRDDILGAFGDPHLTGKSASNDIAQGKKTLLIWKALDKADTEQRKCIHRVYGRAELCDDEHIECIKQIMVETGALAHAKNKIKEIADKMNATIDGLNLKSEGTHALQSLLAFYASEIELEKRLLFSSQQLAS